MSDAPDRVMHKWPGCGDVEYVRADIAVMKPRGNDGSHWATCYEAHGHHACAVQRIDALTETMAECENEMTFIAAACRGEYTPDVEAYQTLAAVKKRIAELTDMHDSDTEELGLIRMLCDGLPVDDDDECETLMQVKRRIAELEARLVELADEHATQLIGAIEQHPDVVSEFREAHEMRQRIAELEARLDTARNLYPQLENITHAEKGRGDA